MRSNIDKRSAWMTTPPTRKQTTGGGRGDPASLPGHARPGRTGGRAGALSVRVGVGTAAAGGMGARRPRRGRVRRARRERAVVADPANLEQVQRGSLGILRREVVTCSPPQFADFLLRWQGVHPDTRRGGSEGLAEVLARLQGLPLDAEVWEQTVLPARVPDYQPRWLDEWIAGGEGVVGLSGRTRRGRSDRTPRLLRPRDAAPIAAARTRRCAGPDDGGRACAGASARSRCILPHRPGR